MLLFAESSLYEEVDVDELLVTLKHKKGGTTTLPTCVSSVISLCIIFFVLVTVTLVKFSCLILATRERLKSDDGFLINFP